MIFTDRQDARVVQLGDSQDIEIVSSTLTSTKEIIGSVSFRQHSARELKYLSEHPEGRSNKYQSDTPVQARLVFTQTKSIDTLIDHLTCLKDTMTKNAKK